MNNWMFNGKLEEGRPMTVKVNSDRGHFDQLRGMVELTLWNDANYVVIFPGPHPDDQLCVVTDMDRVHFEKVMRLLASAPSVL